jgi:hypothetical protein
MCYRSVTQQRMSFHCWPSVVWNMFTERLPSNASHYVYIVHNVCTHLPHLCGYHLCTYLPTYVCMLYRLRGYISVSVHIFYLRTAIHSCHLHIHHTELYGPRRHARIPHITQRFLGPSPISLPNVCRSRSCPAVS